MITNKFQYDSISRETVNGKRLYLAPDGNRLPSVTTILDSTKSNESKDALAAWQNAVGKENARVITTEAAARGTRMHKWLENYIRHGFLERAGSNPYSKQSHLMAETIITCGMSKVNEVWGNEVPLYFPKIYAGTTDACGLHLNKESIIDYKQTNKPKKREWIDDYYLQLVAYAIAHNELHNTNIRKGIIMMCVKPIEIRPGIWDQPIYQEFILEGIEFDKYVNLWWQRLEKYYSKCSDCS